MQAKIDPYACLNLYTAWRMSGSFWLGEQQESQRMIGDVKILQEKYLMSWYVSTFSSPMLMLKNRPCSEEERLIWTLNGLINIKKKKDRRKHEQAFFFFLSICPSHLYTRTGWCWTVPVEQTLAAWCENGHGHSVSQGTRASCAFATQWVQERHVPACPSDPTQHPIILPPPQK